MKHFLQEINQHWHPAQGAICSKFDAKRFARLGLLKMIFLFKVVLTETSRLSGTETARGAEVMIPPRLYFISLAFIGADLRD